VIVEPTRRAIDLRRYGLCAYTFFEGISPPSGLPAPNNLNNLFVTGKLRRGAAVVRR